MGQARRGAVRLLPERPDHERDRLPQVAAPAASSRPPPRSTRPWTATSAAAAPMPASAPPWPTPPARSPEGAAMLPNIDYRELPRAVQRLMARSQTDEAVTLPRRSFLKLAGAGGLALGAFPHLALAQAAGQGGQRAQADRTAVGLRADRPQWRSHGDDQPAGVRPGRADRIADDPGRGTRRRLEPGAQPARLERRRLRRPAASAFTSPAAPIRSRTASRSIASSARARGPCCWVPPRRAGRWTSPPCARRPARCWARVAASWVTANWPRPPWRCRCPRRSR